MHGVVPQRSPRRICLSEISVFDYIIHPRGIYCERRTQNLTRSRRILALICPVGCMNIVMLRSPVGCCLLSPLLHVRHCVQLCCTYSLTLTHPREHVSFVVLTIDGPCSSMRAHNTSSYGPLVASVDRHRVSMRKVTDEDVLATDDGSFGRTRFWFVGLIIVK